MLVITSRVFAQVINFAPIFASYLTFKLLDFEMNAKIFLEGKDRACQVWQMKKDSLHWKGPFTHLWIAKLIQSIHFLDFLFEFQENCVLGQ